MSPVIGSVVFFLVVLTVMSAISAFVISKTIPREKRVALRMVTQPTLTVVGMMFSILLGFFIAQGLKDYSTANSNLINEADALGEVFRDAKGLGEVDRKRIRGLCRDYCNSIIDDEWPLLAQGRASDKAQHIMDELWEASLSVSPADPRETIVYDGYLKAMNELGGLRRVRVATNTSGLAPHLWAIIAIGGAAIVSLTFLFAPENKVFHAAILACLLVPMTLNIYLLSEYNNPFSGTVHVRPVVFNTLKEKIFTQDDAAPHFIANPH